MIPHPEFKHLYLAREPMDMRRQVNGLAAYVEAELQLKLFDPTLFVFCNRQRTIVKMLYWNRAGFAMWYFRLEKERFCWPEQVDGNSITVSSEQLAWLLNGYDITKMKPHQTLSYETAL